MRSRRQVVAGLKIKRPVDRSDPRLFVYGNNELEFESKMTCMTGVPDGEVCEELVVWEYLRRDGKYREWSERSVLKTPDFDNEEENRFRWELSANNPGDVGQLLRIRYPYALPALPPYHWRKEIVSTDLLQGAFLNYGQPLLSLHEVAIQFMKTRTLPEPFAAENALVVDKNLGRLRSGTNVDDFNSVLFCRPTPDLPENSYRIVEGTKRGIAYRVAQLEGIELPLIRGYFGNYGNR